MFGRSAREQSDETLAAQARRGSLASFERLVERYHGRLMDFLMRRGALAQDAEDLVQDALLRAWDKLEHYDPGRRFSTWLFTVTARVAIGESRRRRPALVDPDRWPESAEATAALADPAATIADRDLGQRLWEIVDRELPAEQAGLLWLRYAEGLDIADLAEVSGKKAGAVRVVLHRARVRLASHLEAWRPDQEAVQASLKAGELE